MESKMSIIFIVVKSGGEYSDAWQSNMIASPSKEVCEEYIKNAEAKNKKYNDLILIVKKKTK